MSNNENATATSGDITVSDPGGTSLDESFRSLGSLMGGGGHESLDDGVQSNLESSFLVEGDSTVGDIQSPEKPENILPAQENPTDDQSLEMTEEEIAEECFEIQGQGAVVSTFIREPDQDRCNPFSGFRNIEADGGGDNETMLQRLKEKNENLRVLADAILQVQTFFRLRVVKHTVKAKESSRKAKTTKKSGSGSIETTESITQEMPETEEVCPLTDDEDEDEDPTFEPEDDDEESSESDDEESFEIEQRYQMYELMEEKEKADARNITEFRKVFNMFEKMPWGRKVQRHIDDTPRQETDIGYILMTTDGVVPEDQVFTMIAGVLSSEDELSNFRTEDIQEFPNSRTTALNGHVFDDYPVMCIDSTPFVNLKKDEPAVMYWGGFASHSCRNPNAKMFDFTNADPRDDTVKILLESLGVKVAGHYLKRDDKGNYINFHHLKGVVVLYAIKDITPFTVVTTNYNDKKRGSDFWKTPADFETYIKKNPLDTRETVEYCKCKLLARHYWKEAPQKSMVLCPDRRARVKTQDPENEEAVKRELLENEEQFKLQFQMEIREMVEKITELKKADLTKDVRVIWGFDGFDEPVSESLQYVIDSFNEGMLRIIEIVLHIRIKNHISTTVLDDGRTSWKFTPPGNEEIRNSILPAEIPIGILFSTFNASLSKLLRLYSSISYSEEIYNQDTAICYLQNFLRDHPLRCIDAGITRTSCRHGNVLLTEFADQSWSRIVQDGARNPFKLKHGGTTGRHQRIVKKFIDEYNLNDIFGDRALISPLVMGFTVNITEPHGFLEVIHNGIYRHYDTAADDACYLGLDIEKNIKLCDCMGIRKCPMNGARIKIPEIEQHFCTSQPISEKDALKIVEEAQQTIKEKNDAAMVSGKAKECKSYDVEGFAKFIKFYATPCPSPGESPLDTPAGTPAATPNSKKRKADDARAGVGKKEASTSQVSAESKSVGAKPPSAAAFPGMIRKIVPVVVRTEPSKRAKTSSDDEGHGAGGSGH